MTINFSSLSSSKDNVSINSSLTQASTGHTVGNLNIQGGQSVKPTTPGAYPYQVLASDNLILASSAAPNTITLIASPIKGSKLVVKDITGSAASNNITVNGNGNNIDDAATFVMSVNGQTAIFIFGGTTWFTSSSPGLPLPVSVSNGGTGIGTLSGVLTGNGTSAITAAAVTQYGVLIGGASNAVASTSVGTATHVLTSNGAGVAPTFQTPAAGGITTVGNVTSGTVAFDGTAGTTLTSTTAGLSLLAVNNTGGVGGAVSLTGGATSSAGSAGGSATLKGGAGSTNGAGGAVTIAGGVAGITGPGGSVSVTASNGGTTSGTPGALTLAAGNGQGTTGGTSTLSAGAGLASGYGGKLFLNGGSGGSSAGTWGGDIEIVAGSSTNSSGNAGRTYIIGGTASATGSGGAANLTGGAGGATSGTGGSAVVTGGAGTAGNSAGGTVTVAGGVGRGSSAGGAAQLTGGTAGATGTGGAVTITAGAGGSTSGNGGAITITPGSVTSGTVGAVSITGIEGVTVSNEKVVTIDSSTGQLGTTAVPSPTYEIISKGATLAAGTYIDITGYKYVKFIGLNDSTTNAANRNGPSLSTSGSSPVGVATTDGRYWRTSPFSSSPYYVSADGLLSPSSSALYYGANFTEDFEHLWELELWGLDQTNVSIRAFVRMWETINVSYNTWYGYTSAGSSTWFLYCDQALLQYQVIGTK